MASLRTVVLVLFFAVPAAAGDLEHILEVKARALSRPQLRAATNAQTATPFIAFDRTAYTSKATRIAPTPIVVAALRSPSGKDAPPARRHPPGPGERTGGAGTGQRPRHPGIRAPDHSGRRMSREKPGSSA